MPELYGQLCDFELLKFAYKKTQQGARKYRRESVVFRMAWLSNLRNIQEALITEKYEVGEYNQFNVYEPKERRVSAPKIKDKIVQHATHKLLNDVYRPIYIKDTYACLKNKGEHKAIDQIQHNMRKCQWENDGRGWVLKMDIRKFFYNIDRELLKELLKKKIHDEKFLKHLFKIIDSSPEGEKGLPLGNVTSQDFANIYMNELDQFAKRFLGLEYYVRYNDDIFICTATKERAQEILKRMQRKIEDDLHLQLNQKTKIFPIAQGVKGLGFRIYTTHRLICEDSKKRRKHVNKAMAKKVEAGLISEKDFNQSAQSWLGHARHSNSYNLARKVFKDHSFVQIESPKHRFGEKGKRNGKRSNS